MNLRPATALLVLAAFLGGCMVGPNYQPPKIAAPPQWSSPLAAGETNAPVSDFQWWKSFRDPELDLLLERAGQSNLTLRVAQARVREARAALSFASGGLGPSADTSVSYSESRFSQNGYPPFPPFPGISPEDNVFQAGFDAAWELDVFGGVRREVESARADVAAAEFGRRNVFISIDAEVARNYVNARAFQRRLVVALNNIKAQSDILELTRSLLTNGLATDLDIEQAASLLATTQAQTPTLENGFKASAYHLATLLGQPPGALLDELSGQPPTPVSPPAVPVGLPSDLLLRRPDIRQTERELASATAQIGVATADLFPKFSLTGDIGLQSIRASDWFTAGSRYWSVGPAAQWRVFDSGRIRANIRVQNARQQQALARYEQTTLTAFEEVENALSAYAHEQQRRLALQSAVQHDERALALARQLYANGLTDFLRVLESQRSLDLSQDAAIASDQAVSLDLIALYKALGGGWQNTD